MSDNKARKRTDQKRHGVKYWSIVAATVSGRATNHATTPWVTKTRLTAHANFFSGGTSLDSSTYR